jgi:hypothetical protein
VLCPCSTAVLWSVGIDDNFGHFVVESLSALFALLGAHGLLRHPTAAASTAAAEPADVLLIRWARHSTTQTRHALLHPPLRRRSRLRGARRPSSATR